MLGRFARNIYKLRQKTLTNSICRNSGYSVIPSKSSFATQVNIEVPKTLDNHFEQLQKELKINGFIHYNTFQQTLDCLKESNKITNDQKLFLLETCSDHLLTQNSENRLTLFKQIWQNIIETSAPTKEQFLFAIKVFQVNHFTIEDFRNFFKDYKFEDDLEIYEGLISLASEQGNIKEATEILAQIKDKKLPLTINIFNSLILAHSRNKDIKSCESVMDTMSAANLEPNGRTYAELIRAYIENDSPGQAEKILKERGQDLHQDAMIEIIKAATVKNYDSIIKETINCLPQSVLNSNDIPEKFRSVCAQLVYSGHPEQAVRIVNSFPKVQYKENQDIDKFGAFLISDFIKFGQGPQKTIELCKSLIRSEQNSRALHIACEIALRIKSESCLEYLKALAGIDKLRPHYFWPLLLNDFAQNGETGILNVTKEMVSLNVPCDYDTLSFYILPKLPLTLKEPKKAIKLLEDCGLKTSQIMTPLVSHLIFQQKFAEICDIVRTYQTKVDTGKLVSPIASVAGNLKVVKTISELAKTIAILQSKSQNPEFDLTGQILMEMTYVKSSNNLEKISSFVKELKKSGNQISLAASEVLSNHFQKFGKSLDALDNIVNRRLSATFSEHSDSHIIHPRDMTQEQLECHLTELESKNMNTRGVLRRLLQLCVREGNLVRAVEIKGKCDELKVQRSPGMVASILDLFCKIEDLKQAEKAYQDIKRLYPGFILDEHKVIDYASLLIKNNRLEDAKNILQQRASTTKVVGGSYVNKNVWNLLTNVAINSAKLNTEHNETKEMLSFLHSLGYCTYTNTLLGAVVREDILKNQLRSAITEFKNFAVEHRKTPLQQEIMTILVALSNGKNTEQYNIPPDEAKVLLQDVIQQSASIHGGLRANINFVIAMAESGTENQLRKLLIDPSIKLNQEELLKNLEHLSDSGKIETLMKLAKAVRGLGHSVREQDMYNILLNSFVRENNCESAIQLFNKLESDDEFKISQEFVRVLVDLLKKNLLEIPSNIALRAKLL